MSEVKKEGYKLIRYEVVPEFDQSAQYIKQGEVIERDDYIEVWYAVVDLEEDMEVEEEIESQEIYDEQEPWEDTPVNKKNVEFNILKKRQEETENALMMLMELTMIGGM